MSTTFDPDELARCAQLVDEVSQWVIDYTGNQYSNRNYYPLGVPAVIKGVAARAVARGMNADPTNFSVLTVGDITEQYNGLLDFPESDQKILDLEGGGKTTVYLASGGSYPYCGPGIAVVGPCGGGCGCL